MQRQRREELVSVQLWLSVVASVIKSLRFERFPRDLGYARCVDFVARFERESHDEVACATDSNHVVAINSGYQFCNVNDS